MGFVFFFEENKLQDKDFTVSLTQRLWTLVKTCVIIEKDKTKKHWTPQKKKRELGAAIEDQWPWHICPWAYMESMWPVFTCRTGFQVNKVTAVLCSGPWRQETQGSSDATIVELPSWYKHNVYGIGPIPVLDHWLFSLLVVASCQGNNEIIYCVIFEWAQNLTFHPSSKGSKVQHSDGISPFFFLLTESRAPENAHGLTRLCATCSQHRS